MTNEGRMTNEEAKKMLKAKLECLKNETSGINHDCNMRLCDGCSLNYEQGNMGEQKEALDMAIKALEQQPKSGEWIVTGYDYKCTNCEAEINGEINYMSKSKIKYCPYCGIKLEGECDNNG